MVEELIPSLQRIDPELGPLTLSECTYRIYRDTRFSPDKTPYKVHMGAYINRQGKKSPFAGYYVHISPVEGSLWGGGLYCPDPRIPKAVREDIYEHRRVSRHPARSGLCGAFPPVGTRQIEKSPLVGLPPTGRTSTC